MTEDVDKKGYTFHWRALTKENDDSYDDSGQYATSEFHGRFSIVLVHRFDQRKDKGEECEKRGDDRVEHGLSGRRGRGRGQPVLWGHITGDPFISAVALRVVALLDLISPCLSCHVPFEFKLSYRYVYCHFTRRMFSCSQVNPTALTG